MGEIRIESTEMCKALSAGLRVSEVPLTVRANENGVIEIEEDSGRVVEIIPARRD